MKQNLLVEEIQSTAKTTVGSAALAVVMFRNFKIARYGKTLAHVELTRRRRDSSEK